MQSTGTANMFLLSLSVSQVICSPTTKCSTANNWVNYYRQRVEHIIGLVKKHGAFRQPFRGNHVLLRGMVDLTMQMANCAIKQGWEATPKMRYPGHDFGAHDRYAT